MLERTRETGGSREDQASPTHREFPPHSSQGASTSSSHWESATSARTEQSDTTSVAVEELTRRAAAAETERDELRSEVDRLRAAEQRSSTSGDGAFSSAASSAASLGEKVVKRVKRGKRGKRGEAGEAGALGEAEREAREAGEEYGSTNSLGQQLASSSSPQTKPSETREAKSSEETQTTSSTSPVCETGETRENRLLKMFSSETQTFSSETKPEFRRMIEAGRSLPDEVKVLLRSELAARELAARNAERKNLQAKIEQMIVEHERKRKEQADKSRKNFLQLNTGSQRLKRKLKEQADKSRTNFLELKTVMQQRIEKLKQERKGGAQAQKADDLGAFARVINTREMGVQTEEQTSDTAAISGTNTKTLPTPGADPDVVSNQSIDALLLALKDSRAQAQKVALQASGKELRARKRIEALENENRTLREQIVLASAVESPHTTTTTLDSPGTTTSSTENPWQATEDNNKLEDHDEDPWPRATEGNNKLEGIHHDESWSVGVSSVKSDVGVIGGDEPSTNGADEQSSSGQKLQPNNVSAADSRRQSARTRGLGSSGVDRGRVGATAGGQGRSEGEKQVRLFLVCESRRIATSVACIFVLKMLVSLSRAL